VRTPLLVVGAVVAIVGVIALRPAAPARTLLVVGAVVAIIGGIALHTELLNQHPLDFTINRVAADRLLDRKDLYDRDASRRQIAADIDEPLGGGPFFTYNSPPSTALLNTPWARIDYSLAWVSFEALQALLMLGAVFITGLTVPRSRRPVVWLIGCAALPFFFSVASSLSHGQTNGFVMVALALAIWASVRRRWYLLGAALGFAGLVKVSPWLVLGFVLLRVGRNRRRVALGAAVTVGILLLASMLIGRAGDLGTWVTDVAPIVARGTRYVENQSIPALIERLFTGSDHIIETTSFELGSIRFLGYAIGIASALGLWWWRRGTPFDPIELGLMILVALLSGPLTWVHYLSWAVLVLMLLADPGRYDLQQVWSRLVFGLVLAGTAFLAFPLRYPSPEQVAENWLRRPYSGVGTAGLVFYAAAAVWVLARPASHLAAETTPREPVTR
jgi:Glycosyltransferase family 87